MSIIQTIRDKGARVSVILIALALIGFILTDYFSSRSRGGLGGGPGNSVGKVNGINVNYNEFSRKVEQVEEGFKRNGYPSSAQTTQMAVDNAWEQEIQSILLSEQYLKLGIRVTPKELGDILYGENAPADLKSQFTDPKTGVFNAIQAKQQVDQILKRGTPEQKASFNEYLSALIEQRRAEKYISLINNSLNAPRWYAEKLNADNSQMASVSVVRESYSVIIDSTIKITDKEVEDYVKNHKDEFKQTESRTIDFVLFGAGPSKADSLDAKNKLEEKKIEFDTAHSVSQFLESEGVDPSFNYDGYKTLNTIQSAFKDSIVKIPVGSVYGPYLEGSNYMLARLEGVKQVADTAKVRHILIATKERGQDGQMIEKRDTATAKKLADSIRTAIAYGANFDSLCLKFSDDPGKMGQDNVYNGGVYDKVYTGQMVGPFNDFIFTNPVGSKGIVKTDFGYHYIEVLSQKGSSAGYRISFLPREIVVSQETENIALNAANGFAGDSKDQKSFNDNYEKHLKGKGVKRFTAQVARKDGQIMGLPGYARQFVRSVYDAKLGEVMKPEKVESNYVVALVTEVLKEGTQSTAKARPLVEAKLRVVKKGEMLRQKIGKITTLEAAATALGGKPIEKVDSLRMSTRTSNDVIGYEPKVMGAAFNPANKGKIVPEMLAGINGVYVMRVDNVTTTPVTTGTVADKRKELAAQSKQNSSPVEALKKAATIKDKRYERY